MIELAIKHEVALQHLFLEYAFDESFKYYFCYSYRRRYTAPDSTWERLEYAVIERGEVVGLLGYSIDRDSLIATDFSAINFRGSSLAFSKALIKVINDLFVVFKFRKLRFSVEIGNPIEASYDRMVNKYGGRICGVWIAENKLFDGTITDRKWYEIMREDYMIIRGYK